MTEYEFNMIILEYAKNCTNAIGAVVKPMIAESTELINHTSEEHFRIMIREVPRLIQILLVTAHAAEFERDRFANSVMFGVRTLLDGSIEQLHRRYSGFNFN